MFDKTLVLLSDFCRSVDIYLAYPFDAENGKLTSTAIIVCEVVEYLPAEFYDRKLQRKIPTWHEVWNTLITHRKLWFFYGG